MDIYDFGQIVRVCGWFNSAIASSDLTEMERVRSIAAGSLKQGEAFDLFAQDLYQTFPVAHWSHGRAMTTRDWLLRAAADFKRAAELQLRIIKNMEAAHSIFWQARLINDGRCFLNDALLKLAEQTEHAARIEQGTLSLEFPVFPIICPPAILDGYPFPFFPTSASEE